MMGHRGVTLLGSGLSASAFLITALMVHMEIEYLVPYYLITGGLAGLGFGLMYLPAIEIIDGWFDKGRFQLQIKNNPCPIKFT